MRSPKYESTAFTSRFVAIQVDSKICVAPELFASKFEPTPLHECYELSGDGNSFQPTSSNFLPFP